MRRSNKRNPKGGRRLTPAPCRAVPHACKAPLPALSALILIFVFMVQTPAKARPMRHAEWQGTSGSIGAPRALSPGRVVKAEIGGGETHTYLLRLEAGQYARVVVDQKSVYLIMSLTTPTGATLAEVTSLFGTEGLAELWLVAE